jgi:hypothetical protein
VYHGDQKEVAAIGLGGQIRACCAQKGAPPPLPPSLSLSVIFSLALKDLIFRVVSPLLVQSHQSS